jgi:HlyD family secretion protein
MKLNFSPFFQQRCAVWSLTLFAVAVLVIWAMMPRPLYVEVGTVTTGRFEQAINEDGQLRLKNRYVISAPMTAELMRPSLKVGDSVRAGDVVATLMPPAPSMIDERNRLVLQQRVGRDDAARMAAAAQLQGLQTSLAQTELEVQRAQKLARDNFIAPAALDKAVLAKRAAEQALAAGQAQLLSAEFTLAESQAALSKAQPVSLTAKNALVLRSPADGQVVRLYLTSSAPVAVGQALLEIGDIQAVEAVVDVLSSDARQLSPGAAVLMSPGFGATLLNGKITRIEPVAFTKISALGIEEQRVNVIIELGRLPDNHQKLGEGFRIDARIILSSQENVLLVPSAALVRQGAGWQVLVHQNGRAIAKNVDVKQRNADVVWLDPDAANGVQKGDSVLLYPGTITDGQRIQVKNTLRK